MSNCRYSGPSSVVSTWAFRMTVSADAGLAPLPNTVMIENAARSFFILASPTSLRITVGFECTPCCRSRIIVSGVADGNVGSPSVGTYINEPVSPGVVRPYQRLAFPCQHYDARSAALQKVSALAGRAEPQVRDAFDIYVLWLGGLCPEDLCASLEPAAREQALSNVLALDYAQYEGQVLDYLEDDARIGFDGRSRWREVCGTVLGLLEGV